MKCSRIGADGDAVGLSLISESNESVFQSHATLTLLGRLGTVLPGPSGALTFALRGREAIVRGQKFYYFC